MENPSKRLFVAVDFPDTIKTQLSALKTDIPTARWVSHEQMHLTLFFIGDTKQIQEIRDALTAVKTPSFDVVMRGVGRFPPSDRKPPRVLWVGLENQPLLAQLHQTVATALTNIGFEADTRGFSPHVTLARLKVERPLSQVAQFLEVNKDFYTPPIAINVFTLYSSQLSQQGARYTREAVYPLNG
jgi:RNA 2',3'-cyclic 3'-phosphodiesterase